MNSRFERVDRVWTEAEDWLTLGFWFQQLTAHTQESYTTENACRSLPLDARRLCGVVLHRASLCQYRVRLEDQRRVPGRVEARRTEVVPRLRGRQHRQAAAQLHGHGRSREALRDEIPGGSHPSAHAGRRRGHRLPEEADGGVRCCVGYSHRQPQLLLRLREGAPPRARARVRPRARGEEVRYSLPADAGARAAHARAAHARAHAAQPRRAPPAHHPLRRRRPGLRQHRLPQPRQRAHAARRRPRGRRRAPRAALHLPVVRAHPLRRLPHLPTGEPAIACTNQHSDPLPPVQHRRS